MDDSDEVEELAATLSMVQNELEDLVVGGLRAAGAERLAVLDGFREEFERVGAGHLAARFGELAAAIRADDRAAGKALMRAQASLRVFERVLTLRTAAARLELEADRR